MHLHGILETVIYVADLEAAERFYTRVLGLTVHSRQENRHVFFRCGRGMFLVFNPATTATESFSVGGRSVPLHGAHGPGHMAFAVADADLCAWRVRLAEEGVAIETEVAWPSGGQSIYFRDPAGNSIELATPRLWEMTEAMFAIS
jgi:catechol 2,3-dioxygenase-like lactoylglutathione lyase family enzyme